MKNSMATQLFAQERQKRQRYYDKTGYEFDKLAIVNKYLKHKKSQVKTWDFVFVLRKIL